jgi:uncharacterized SAM-binding protein YcdF (DUF218 family)
MSSNNFNFNFFKSSKNIRKTILITLLLLSLNAVIFYKPILISYGNWLSISNPKPFADVAISLGGENRLETAINLLANGKVKIIYIDAVGLEYLEDKVRKSGLPSNKFYWGGSTKNTFDQALTFRRTMNSASFPYRQVVIVSDRYHLRRSQWAFHQVLGANVEVTTYATPANEAMSDPHWWEHKESRDWVISETKKFIFYSVYYGFLGSRSPISPKDFAN